MPSKQAHVAAAKSNQAAIDYLLKEDTHLAWVVTIAFYKALHTVEALLASGSESVKHFDEHKTRNKFLKSDHRYSQIWKMYRPLFEASLVARYLKSDSNEPAHEVFSEYMSRQKVESLVIGHFLRQLEKSVCNLSGDPNFLA